MVSNNESRFKTPFTVSIEARKGVSTGVSAADRVTTIRTAIASNAVASDLTRPGHVFPLRAAAGGVLERQGHTEGSVELVRLAGFKPAAVLCELTNPNGTMAKGTDTDKDGVYSLELAIDAEDMAPVDWSMEAYTADFKKVELSGRRIVQREDEEEQEKKPIIVTNPIEFVVSFSK